MVTLVLYFLLCVKYGHLNGDPAVTGIGLQLQHFDHDKLECFVAADRRRRNGALRAVGM